MRSTVNTAYSNAKKRCHDSVGSPGCLKTIESVHERHGIVLRCKGCTPCSGAMSVVNVGSLSISIARE